MRYSLLKRVCKQTATTLRRARRTTPSRSGTSGTGASCTRCRRTPTWCRRSSSSQSTAASSSRVRSTTRSRCGDLVDYVRGGTARECAFGMAVWASARREERTMRVLDCGIRCLCYGPPMSRYASVVVNHSRLVLSILPRAGLVTPAMDHPQGSRGPRGQGAERRHLSRWEHTMLSLHAVKPFTIRGTG